MKKTTLLFLLLITSISCYSQFGVSIHQSNLPFAGFNYQINDRFLPELRVGIDQYFNDLSLEATVSYIFVKNDLVNFYGGVGARTTAFEGLVLPVGLNIYPFETKNFGFQMELAGLLGEASLLRGSWGIRYRFRKE